MDSSFPRSPEKVLDQARTYVQLGYFEGAEKLALKAQEKLGGALRLSAGRLAWFAQVYQSTPESLARAGERVEEMWEWIKTQKGGAGCSELGWVLHRTRPEHLLEKTVDGVIQSCRQQGGRSLLHHPSALLRLASEVLKDTSEMETAIRLVNMVLGYRRVFVSLEDVRLLGSLLVRIQAPEPTWMRWAWICAQHIGTASQRAGFLNREFQDPEACEWAHGQDHASLDVLREILPSAPAVAREMFIDAWDWCAGTEGDSRSMRNILAKSGIPHGKSGKSAPVHPLWWGHECLAFRYFWFAGFEPEERDLVQNGDWSLFCGPNPDRSMAVAQWWRLLERVIKRSVVVQVSTLFSQNPGWLEADRNSKRIMDEERVFLQWADPEQVSKSTLGQMLVGIEKMLQGPGSSGSLLRKGASEWLHATHYPEAVRAFWLQPPILTDKNIRRFRNASSHDGIFNLEKAAFGSLCAAEFVSRLALPELGAEWEVQI
jgi:hypothetical protein